MQTESENVPESETPGSRWNPLVITGLALATAALVAAGYFGFSWLSEATSTSVGYAQMRDDVLRAGEQATKNLNSLDYRDLDADLGLWQSSTTGDLHNQITSTLATIKSQTQAAKVIASAKVDDGAVTDLDNHACTATVIVAVEITVTPPTGSPAVKPNRIVSKMLGSSDNNGGCSSWKLSGIQQVPVDDAAGASAAPPAPTTPSGP